MGGVERLKISVIMLTYNRGKLVSRAIESVLNQTFRDFEFIIVDNGSTDQSGVIADSYAAKDSRIRVIHRERGNIGSGRNTGLDIANGEWIAFVDDDDWCEPDFLEFLIDLAMENNADIAICGAEKEENGRHSLIGIEEKVVLNAEEAIIELMWRKRFNNGFPTKLFKRSLLSELRFPETGLYDDIHLMYKALAAANCIVSYGIVKYHVYRHEGNNSAATSQDRMITSQYLCDYRAAYRERTIWLCERFPSNTYYWCYFEWSFMISMVNKIIKNELTGCTIHLNEMQQELSRHREKFINAPWILEYEREWVCKYA